MGPRLLINCKRPVELISKKDTKGKKITVVKASKEVKIKPSSVIGKSSGSASSSSLILTSKGGLGKARKADAPAASKGTDAKSGAASDTWSGKAASGSSSRKLPKSTFIEPPVEKGDIFRVQTTRDSTWYVHLSLDVHVLSGLEWVMAWYVSSIWHPNLISPFCFLLFPAILSFSHRVLRRNQAPG